MGKMDQQVVIITGAASGMGKAMAGLFAAEGARVLAADRDEAGLSAVVDQIRATGGVIKGVSGNVGLEKDVQRFVDTAISEFGSVDVLINNAGILDNFETAESVSNELWERVMAINLYGPLYACRAVLPHMLKKGKGVIINNASVGGLFGERGGVAYVTSKHGLIGMTRNIGFTYAQQGIRCNAIAPGGVNTNIARDIHPNPLGYEKISLGFQTIPRQGESEEIARVALFLASDDSSFVNGTVIVADGGWTAY